MRKHLHLHLILFFEVFNSARDVAFPEVIVKQKHIKTSHSPWMTLGLRVSQKRKEKLFSKNIKKRTDTNKLHFKNYNTIYNKLRRAANQLYYNNQFSKFTRNCKQTWSVIR